MSRRKSGQAVSLFPFLAVLVSAMGALILLLLVTTRKLHNDAVAKAKAEQAQQAAEAAQNLVPLPIPEDDPAFATDAAEFVVTVQSPAKQLLPPAPPPVPDQTLEREALRRQWEDKLAELREKWDRLQKRLKQGQVLLTTQAQEEEGLAVELSDLQARINQLLAEKSDISEKVETAKSTELTLSQQLAILQAELDKLKAEKKDQANKFQLVPYAGTSPTRRRPIVIECDAKAIRFPSEEISLSARDVSGFNAEYNPVRAGTDALLKYWDEQRMAEKSAASGLQPEPYLLFVIRPGGTVSYYVARRMLEGLATESGYELVSESQELIWPITTPDAKAECQTAINEVLAVRNRVAASMPDGRLPVTQELQFEGPNGEFMLEEVQKLRNPTQKLVFGSQRVTRRERPRTNGSVYKPPSAPDQGGFVGPRLDDLRDELGRMPPGRRPEREAQAAQRGHSQAEGPRGVAPGRVFPEEPPPRIAQRGKGADGSSQSQGSGGNGASGSEVAGPEEVALSDQGKALADAKSSGEPGAAATGKPARKLKPSWETTSPDELPGTEESELLTPEELARKGGVPRKTRQELGSYEAEAGGQAAGRGTGNSSGEATSAYGDEGELNNLLVSPDAKAMSQKSEPHPPTNSSRPFGESANQPGGHPGGDRTSADETTTDPSLAGDSKPGGVPGGKGTWSGEGSSAAAPDSVPVQEGATGTSALGGMSNPPGQPDSTEEAISKHLPRPLPVPAVNSIAAERYVAVTIDSDQIQIGKHSIPIEAGMSDHELQREFSKELAKLPQRWGRPPQGFHWQPAIRFRVRPGGNLYYAWLQSASQEWGLRNTLEYVFD